MRVVKFEVKFHFMAGSSFRQYNHLMSLPDSLAKLQYATSKSPFASRWMDNATSKEFWRPKLGEIHVSLSEEFKKYNTAAGAYTQAVRIKKLMIKQIEMLTVNRCKDAQEI